MPKMQEGKTHPDLSMITPHARRQASIATPAGPGEDVTHRPNTDRLCAECSTAYVPVDDPTGLCADCQAEWQATEPGSISQEQRRQIAALLLAREPVAKVESMADFINDAIGADFGPTNSLWELSAKQGGDLLEALESERQAVRVARLSRSVDYRGKRRQGGAMRRPSQGAHRARN